jgi:Domain of unknown function (DUF4270)
MMNQNVRILKRSGLFLSACFVSIACVFTSCKKTTSDLGIGILNADQLIEAGGVDTFSLVTYTVAEDSLPTDNQSYAVLGSCHDPIMGVFNANFYTQFGLVGTTTFEAGETFTVDSVVLALDYAGYFGEMDPLTFKVERLMDGLEDKDYYKYDEITNLGSDLVDPSYSTQTPNPIADVVVGQDTLDAQLRIKLLNSLGDGIIADAVAGNIAFTTDAEFKNYFKGLKVSVQQTNPSVGNGGILYLDLNKNNTRLTVYYHDSNNDQFDLSFQVEDNCYDFNHVEINNAGYKPNQILSNASLGQTEYYAQAFKSRAAIRFPGVSNLKKSTVIQNALLELPIQHHPQSKYFPSLSVNAIFVNEDGENVLLGLASYNSSRNSYTLNIRSYLQDIVAGKIENKEILVSTSYYFSSSADRIVFNGPNSTNKLKPRLVIKYTEF